MNHPAEEPDLISHEGTGRSVQGHLRSGLCSITFRHLPATEIVALAAQEGIEGIEWGADVHLLPGDTAGAEKLALRCRGAGVECPSYGSYLRAGADGTERGEVTPVLDSAEALGAPNVRVWTAWASPESTSGDRREAIAEDLAGIADAAAARELTISLEFHPFTLTETSASTLELLNECGSPSNLYTYWQPGDGQAVTDSIDELKAVRRHVSHLHVFSWANFADRFPLADGAELWPVALRAASAAGGRWGGDRFAFLEFVRNDSTEQLHADAETLRRWLDDCDT